MPISRRDLLKSGLSAAALAAIATVPRPLLASLGGPVPDALPPLEDPRIRELALAAMEAARAAGASYADIRLTHTRRRLVSHVITDSEGIAVGVRALLDGYWGFCSGPVWSLDEMVRLGREAVYQARANALGSVRSVGLAPATVVRDGHWVMPVEVDPFELSPLEIQDVLRGLTRFAERMPRTKVSKNECELVVQEKAFASSEGSYCTQRLYRTAGEFVISVELDGRKLAGALDLLTPAGVGWELYSGQPLQDAIRRLADGINEDLRLPVKPVEVGRYDTVCDATSVARLLDESLGRATELDRAMGYEANAGGTSYLSDPLGMVGSFQMGAPLLTVTGNRSEKGGAATVRWDDEGVEPDECKLVDAGVLTDLQTTRESASWLKEYYARATRPVRSHGHAAAPSALAAPLQHPPNFTLAPGRETLDFDAIVTGLDAGVAVREMGVSMDFQGLNGLATGRFYQVRRGKRVARLNAAGILFRAPELWNGLLTLGGSASARRFGVSTRKGEPEQLAYHSVTAVPAVFRELTVIDVLRKA